MLRQRFLAAPQKPQGNPRKNTYPHEGHDAREAIPEKPARRRAGNQRGGPQRDICHDKSTDHEKQIDTRKAGRLSRACTK